MINLLLWVLLVDNNTHALAFGYPTLFLKGLVHFEHERHNFVHSGTTSKSNTGMSLVPLFAAFSFNITLIHVIDTWYTIQKTWSYNSYCKLPSVVLKSIFMTHSKIPVSKCVCVSICSGLVGGAIVAMRKCHFAHGFLYIAEYHCIESEYPQSWTKLYCMSTCN